MRLAFDGYSASGKSLAAKLISKKYKLHLLNSGLLYRYAAFLIIKNKPKNKIVKGRFAQKKGFKKAVVTLKKGQTIDLATGV